MARLIDIDEVIKTLEECHLDKLLFEKDVFEKVDAIPTAYDVEKVVAELEDMKLIRVEQCHGDYEIEVMTNNNFVDAIDIVRKGGINE